MARTRKDCAHDLTAPDAMFWQRQSRNGRYYQLCRQCRTDRRAALHIERGLTGGPQKAVKPAKAFVAEYRSSTTDRLTEAGTAAYWGRMTDAAHVTLCKYGAEDLIDMIGRA